MWIGQDNLSVVYCARVNVAAGAATFQRFGGEPATVGITAVTYNGAGDTTLTVSNPIHIDACYPVGCLIDQANQGFIRCWVDTITSIRVITANVAGAPTDRSYSIIVIFSKTGFP